jgi:hypothetical protein
MKRKKWPEITPLGRYILDLCHERRMSMREACLAADPPLSEGTLAKIIKRGAATQPRPETLQRLAVALDGDYTEMLRLAGYVEPRQEARIAEMSPELRQLIDELAALEREDKEAAQRVVAAILLLIEAKEIANSAESISDDDDVEFEQAVLPSLPEAQRHEHFDYRRGRRINHQRARTPA